MKRELTAAIAAPFAIWMIRWAHPYVFDAAMALVAALALYEFLDLGKRKGYHLPIPLCMVVMLFIVAAFILEPISVEMGVFVALLVIPGSYVISGGSLEQALPSSAIAVLATLYVGMLGGSLIRLHNDFADGSKLVFFLLLSTRLLTLLFPVTFPVILSLQRIHTIVLVRLAIRVQLMVLV